MLYRIALCDDNKVELNYIKVLIEKWAEFTGNMIEINEFSSAESFLFKYEEFKLYDIVFLDVEMKEMNGVDLARIIRKDNKEIQIVFASGYMEYILDGYEVEALYYLLKPVNENKLNEVLNKAVEKLNKNKKAIIIQYQGEMIRIPLYEIKYIDVQKNYITIHANENIRVKQTLSDIERELDESFFRTGRSYIVNITYIKKVTKKEIYLITKDIIPLPRGMYESLNNYIIKFL